MSLYGKRWLIDGLTAGMIMRSVPGNGQYTVVFEREFASLEQIEAVNWAKPTVEYIGPHGSEAGLPEGYGFEVADIQEQQETISEQTAALQEKEATITEQAATIQELEQSGGGAAITEQLEAAYQEGVESNG